MDRIWLWTVLGAGIYALINSRAGAAAEAVIASGDASVEMLLTILASMTLWSGLMEILTETGDVARIGKGLRRVMMPLMPHLQDEASWAAMSLNISANLLGLGNAATPAGVEAAKRLAGQGEAGIRALAMLLVINSSSLQLMPTTVISLRQSAGSQDAAAIWLPTIIASAASLITGVAMLWLLQKGDERIDRRKRLAPDRDGRTDSAAGRDGAVRCVRGVPARG